MASTKRSRRTDTIPQGNEKDRTDRSRGTGPAVTSGRAVEGAIDSVQEIERLAADPTGGGIVVGVEREIVTRRPLTLSSTYQGVLSLRREIANRLHDDVESFLRAILKKGADVGSSPLDRSIALRAAALIYDKTLGQPREAVDEAQATGLMEVTDRAVIAQAEKIQKAASSAPLEKFIDAATRGIVRRPKEPPTPASGAN